MIIKVVLLALIVGGCSLGQTLKDLDSNDLGTIVCTSGDAPVNMPFVQAGGKLVLIKMNQGFEGIVQVTPDCAVIADHYRPYKQKVDELRRRENWTPAISNH